jgi:monolysocardiolipin acyltransferase
MPEGRRFPWKYIPRLGVKLSVSFGDPLSPEEIRAVLRAHAVDGEDRLFGVDHVERVRERVARESNSTAAADESRKRKTDHARSMITVAVQQTVEAVGRRISGATLGKKMDV